MRIDNQPLPSARPWYVRALALDVVSLVFAIAFFVLTAIGMRRRRSGATS